MNIPNIVAPISLARVAKNANIYEENINIIFLDIFILLLLSLLLLITLLLLLLLLLLLIALI
jgi:hypothetical protein